MERNGEEAAHTYIHAALGRKLEPSEGPCAMLVVRLLKG
jgi:hypothetical protein